MRTLRLATAALLAIGTLTLGAGPAFAVGTASIKATATAEAWYRSTPACMLPTGCADATGAPSPYSPDTLHVSVVAGVEETRTYLQLDLSALPPGTAPTGGTLRLPILTGPQDGTRLPDTATLQACAVSAPVEDADGSFATPPPADCDAAAAPAVFAAADGDDPPVLTVDLTPLVSAWGNGSTPGAVALVPSAETAPPASWHTAFADRNLAADGPQRIRATLLTASSVVAVPPLPTQPDTAFPDSGSGSDSTFDSGGGFVATPDSGAGFDAAPLVPADEPLAAAPEGSAVDAPAVAPSEQAAARPAAVSQATLLGPSVFRYPVVFLLPLLFALGVAWAGRALTRDLTLGTRGAQAPAA